jgi:hypothetical protein
MNLLTTTWLRRSILLGTPLVLGGVTIFHPIDFGAEPYSIVAGNPTWWTILHLLQLPLFALLALAVLLLTWNMPGRTPVISRIALGFFVIFYTALDAVTGIASGIIVRNARHLPAEEQVIIEPLVSDLFLGGGPYTFIPLFAILGWAIAAGAAAHALSKAGAARLPVVLLYVAAISFGITHEPPFGPIGLAAFVVAVAMLEFAPTRFWRTCPVPFAAVQPAAKAEKVAIGAVSERQAA